MPTTDWTASATRGSEERKAAERIARHRRWVRRRTRERLARKRARDRALLARRSVEPAVPGFAPGTWERIETDFRRLVNEAPSRGWQRIVIRRTTTYRSHRIIRNGDQSDRDDGNSND